MMGVEPPTIHAWLSRSGIFQMKSVGAHGNSDPVCCAETAGAEEKMLGEGRAMSGGDSQGS